MIGDDNHCIHPLLLHLAPAPRNAHVRPVVRRGVEVIRYAAVFLRGLDQRVPLAHGMAAPGGERLEELIQLVHIGSRDAHFDSGRVVVGPSDDELQDFVLRLEFNDLVEDCRQVAGVDQVSFGLYRVARAHGCPF